MLYETDYGVTFDAAGCVNNYYDSDSFAGYYTFVGIRNSLNGPNGPWKTISTSITLYPQPSPPSISYFYADQSTINRGQCTYLRWGSQNATAAYLSGEDVATEGWENMCPTSTTQYVLTAQNDSGQSARAFYTIHVNSQVDAASFVTQTALPNPMVAGTSYPLSVTMKNTGTTTWSEAGSYHLGSQNPQDNVTWGLGRVFLGPTETVAPGASKTFTFNVRAPSTAGNYNYQWRMVRDGVAWFGSSTVNLVGAVNLPPPPPQPTSMSFSPTQGNAGNDAYTLTVGGGANMSIGLKYEWSGNPGYVTTVDQWTPTLDSSGQARNIKINHNDAPGTYWYHAIKNYAATDWVNFSSPYPALTILPPRPFAGTLSMPSPITPPSTFTVTAGNMGGVAADTRYTLNNTGPFEEIGWPIFGWAANNPPGGELAYATINASMCTPTGQYVYTGLRNTLLPSSAWSDEYAGVLVNCPGTPAIIPNVVGSVVAGTTATLTLSGNKLCGPMTIWSDETGITFPVDPTPNSDYSGSPATATFTVASTVSAGQHAFHLSTPCGQTTGYVNVDTNNAEYISQSVPSGMMPGLSAMGQFEWRKEIKRKREHMGTNSKNGFQGRSHRTNAHGPLTADSACRDLASGVRRPSLPLSRLLRPRQVMGLCNTHASLHEMSSVVFGARAIDTRQDSV